MLLQALQMAVQALKSTAFTYADCVDWGNKIVWHTTIREAEEVRIIIKDVRIGIITNKLIMKHERPIIIINTGSHGSISQLLEKIRSNHGHQKYYQHEYAWETVLPL